MGAPAYSKYLRATVDPPQRQVGEAVAAGPVNSQLIPRRSAIAKELALSNYSPVETGFGLTERREVWVACLTDMPGVTPAMWDWWFGWHSSESSRYQLWHPEAHVFAAFKHDTSRAPLADRARYRGNVSYVDEVIGGDLNQLAIAFHDPAHYGINGDAGGGTVICGTVGTVLAPVNVGVLFHQIRPTPSGAEMRSRFYLNVPGVRTPDLRATARALKRGLVVPSSVRFKVGFGAHLLQHCGEEMNHLAQFLPELHAEFGHQAR